MHRSFEDIVLELRAKLAFLMNATSLGAYDHSEKTDAYWDGLSYLIEDLADQVKILQSSPTPIHFWGEGQDEESFLAAIDDYRRRATCRGDA